MGQVNRSGFSNSQYSCVNTQKFFELLPLQDRKQTVATCFEYTKQYGTEENVYSLCHVLHFPEAWEFVLLYVSILLSPTYIVRKTA